MVNVRKMKKVDYDKVREEVEGKQDEIRQFICENLPNGYALDTVGITLVVIKHDNIPVCKIELGWATRRNDVKLHMAFYCHDEHCTDNDVGVIVDLASKVQEELEDILSGEIDIY